VSYSGNLVRTTTVDSNFKSRENWGTTADPGHAQREWGSDQGFPELKQFRKGVTPENVEDHYNPTGVNADPNILPPDHEPSGHEGIGAPSRTSNEYDNIRSDTRRHSVNLGAMMLNSATIVMRSVTARFGSPLIQSLPPQTDDASASSSGEARRALRGFNSLAENNMGSPTVNYSGNYIRQGRELFRVNDRSMPTKQLTHTYRPVYLNLATTAKETTSPQGSSYSINSSPYTSVAAMNVGALSPMQRREPRAWDESAVTDGSEDAYAADNSQFVSWGM
jgi:hypothetical protein